MQADGRHMTLSSVNRDGKLASKVGVAEIVSLLEGGVQRAELEINIELLGEVDRREGANPVTFANALDLLVRQGVLAPAAQKAGREEEAFVRGEAFGDLPGLRERLASALPAR